MGVKLEVLQQQLGKKKSHLINQDTVDELNKLAEDPDYGQEFLDSYISHFNILEHGKWDTPKYMNAMKYFTLVEAGHSQTDAYIKTFPERLEARIKRGEDKSRMGGEASRFNQSELVNEIRKVAAIPVQLIHRHLLHEAIMKQAELMHNEDVSYAVQQKAAESLIRELKPAEDSTVNIKVGQTDEVKQQQAQLLDHLGSIAINQQKMLAAGLSIEEIQKLNVQVTKDDIIEGEIDE